MNVNSQSSTWPGQHTNPSQEDVALASEQPDPAFLSEFKKALISSEQAAGCGRLLHLDFKSSIPPAASTTYPLAILDNFPILPPDEQLARLSRTFSKRCTNHILFGDLFIFSVDRVPVAPPLLLGKACFASIAQRAPVEEIYRLFSAGASLWSAMMEVDNALSRSFDMLIATVLLIPCGVLAGTNSLRKMTSLMLCSSLTAIDDGAQTRTMAQQPSILWSLWLWDVLNALHSGDSLNFAPHEVLLNMPSTTIPFREAYCYFIQEHIDDVNITLHNINSNSREQAILLLLAILSELIVIQRSLGAAVNVVSPAQKHNPFVPFSRKSELARMQNRLSVALDRWQRFYEDTMSPDIVALFYYCRLYLDCPEMPSLPYLAQYELAFPVKDSIVGPNEIVISQKSLRHAWTLLDTAAICPKVENELCAAWLPIIVFQASLVVWADISLANQGQRGTQASTRALLAFQIELETMPWPCSAVMAATLHRIISGKIGQS